MSGADAGAGKTENAAAAEFARYKARMAEGAVPVMMPMMMAGGGMPNWAVPPSLATFGAPLQPAGAQGHENARSIGEGLGSTVRLGIELLNAFLASSAGALGGAVMMLPHGEHGREEGSCGCGCHCGTDCCAAFGCQCCEPGISGCCR